MAAISRVIFPGFDCSSAFSLLHMDEAAWSTVSQVIFNEPVNDWEVIS